MLLPNEVYCFNVHGYKSGLIEDGMKNLTGIMRQSVKNLLVELLFKIGTLFFAFFLKVSIV